MTTELESEGAKRILAIDDDPSLLQVYRRALSASGYLVDTAASGTEATEKLRSRAYSAIVSDISMPGMDGISLLRATHAYDVDIPVILITGLPSMGTAVAAVNEGAFRYLVKPFDLQDLQSSVSAAVRQHRRVEVQRHALAGIGVGSSPPGEATRAEIQLERALAGLWMAFQPIVSAATGGLFAYEGLLRTREPTVPSPGSFLELAEGLGRLTTLGRATRRALATQLAEAVTPCDLFVNLHPADLADDLLFSQAEPLSTVSNRVVLEVTERAMLESVPQAVDRLAELRRMGFGLAIDDLGAGYSGLNSFVQLEPEVVKLDMSLIRGIDHSDVKRRLVRSLVAACKDLGAQVVAEGIETEAERQVTAELGCDLQQGYLLGRPAWPVRPFEPLVFDPPLLALDRLG